MHLGIFAYFEFNWNSSAESYLLSTLQIRRWKWHGNSKSLKVIHFFEIQRLRFQKTSYFSVLLRSLLFSKCYLAMFIRFPSEIKSLSIDPVFTLASVSV